jgi:hypothetical protein
MEKAGQDSLFAALKKHDLSVGFLAGSGEADFRKHLDTFKRMIDAAAPTRYRSRFTSIVIREKIISATKKTKPLLITPPLFPAKRAAYLPRNPPLPYVVCRSGSQAVHAAESFTEAYPRCFALVQCQRIAATGPAPNDGDGY